MKKDEIQTNFKVKKIRDKAHLKFIRGLPCIRCFTAPSEAAHIRRYSDGGVATKPSDSFAIPLCACCHAEQHRIGELSFHQNMDKVHELARYLWEHTGLWKECILRIREYISSNQRRT